MSIGHLLEIHRLLEALLQYIIYDWNDFVADIGGYLGLLLGQSVYGMYEILTNCHYKALVNWLKERKAGLAKD